MAAFLAVLYIITGVGTAIWFLADITRTKVAVQADDGTSSERRVIQVMHLPSLIGIILLMLVLGPPIMVARFLFKQDSSADEDPQDRVPPKYR